MDWYPLFTSGSEENEDKEFVLADLMQQSAGPGRLREMLAGSEPVLAPGAYDALSARLAEEAGFGAVYITGFGTAASLLGGPDIGLLTMSEMVEKGHAAVEARRSEEFVIIARTDARAVEGMDGALERARRYREAGADVLFVEAPQSEEEIAAVAETFPEVPLLFNWVESGKTPPVSLERLKELGFRLIIFPVSALLAATVSMREVFARIHAEGTPTRAMDRLLPLGEFIDFIGLPEVRKLEEHFSDEEVWTPR